MIIGHLDGFSSGSIFGWMGSFTGDSLPFITANGKPCQLRSSNLSRPDVAETTGLREDSGFIADVPHLESTQIEFKLYAVTADGVSLVDSRTFYGAALNPKRFSSIFDALEIARNENAVAIISQQAADNNIFRAYTLYKAVTHKRPAIIIAFSMEMSEPEIWHPLKNSDAKLLIIPWRDRELYFSLFKEIGFSFNTIWICNTSYHSYELAWNIANQNTCFIQDIDINHTRDLNKIPVESCIADLMGRKFFNSINSRSLSNPTLTQTISGNVVCYSQPYAPALRERQSDPTQEVRVGYVSVVVQDNGLIQAATAIDDLNRSRGLKIKLIISCAEIDPHLHAQLDALGCEFNHNLDLNNLNLYAQDVDVLICGFPIEASPMSDLGSSAVIAWALSNNRPVLVPELQVAIEHISTPGVYLFNQQTFLEKLTSAVADNTQLLLPESLTPEFNYNQFVELEAQAKKSNVNFKDIFDNRYEPIINKPIPRNHKKTNVVLVWKQHDAGLYGRRVDQVARTLIANNYSTNVICLEVIDNQRLAHYKNNSDKIESDNQYIYADFLEKKSGVYRDGVFFKTLLCDEADTFASTMNRFLIEKRLFPTNTAFILFPAVTEAYGLLSSIEGYKIISDIVDNQLTWLTGTPLPLINQYLTLNHFSQQIIFNSDENLKYFTGKNIFSAENSHLVPNWYRTPVSYTAEPLSRNKKKFFDLLYSGNMNDRIDWSLLKNLHDRTPENVRIHLVGTADTALDQLIKTLDGRNKFIYHGPMRERDLLTFANSCDLALLPHSVDMHATYMNPMKVNMYYSIGLPCISTDVPGIDKETPDLFVCQTQEDFIKQTIDLLGMPRSSVIDKSFTSSKEQKYIEIVDTLFLHEDSDKKESQFPNQHHFYSYLVAGAIRLKVSSMRQIRNLSINPFNLLTHTSRLDVEWYLKNNPDVAASGISAKEHYKHFGRVEGRLPCPPNGLDRFVARVRVSVPAIKHLVATEGGYSKATTRLIDTYKADGYTGLKHLVVQVFRAHESRNRISYASWIESNELNATDFAQAQTELAKLPEQPLISIIMPTYNSNLVWLEEAIESIRIQPYKNWELCIADDASPNKNIASFLEEWSKRDSRIKYVIREKNGHISEASNSAIDIAQGEWLALFDHDDLLHPFAFYWVVLAINQNQDSKLIYSDEDKINEQGERHAPYFKPAWNYDLFLSQNCFSHLGLIKRDLAVSIGGFRKGFEGSQDHDLILRAIEKISEEQIIHIPKVLYHWRVHAESTAKSSCSKPYAALAGERAIREHLQRIGRSATVSFEGYGYRVQYQLPAKQPLVSLIIPTRNGVNLLRQCLESITKKTTYKNYEFIIVDNGSDEPETLAYLDSLKAWKNARIIRDDRPFNYSQLNNLAAKEARGEILGLINNDIEVIEPDWLSEMVSHVVRPEIGAVGAKLLFPNNTLQHGGVVLGVGGVANHAHLHIPHHHHGYFARASLIQQFSAVTAACLLVRKSVYDEASGLDEVNLKVAFNDVDFCIRLKKLGYKNIWTPYAKLYHHESATRGEDIVPEKRARFVQEVNYMMDTWGKDFIDDPAYNPNLNLDFPDFALSNKKRLDKWDLTLPIQGTTRELSVQ